MTKKPATLLAILLLGIVAILFWLTRSPDEPTYQHRSLHSWLKDLKNWDGDTNAAAYVAFREMGTNAIPSLLNVIESGGPRIDRIIMKINQKQSLVRLPFGRPWDYTMAATRALYAMGTNAKPALPALTNLLLQTNALNAQFESAIVLAGIGSDALPVLLTALTNQNYRIRSLVASGLGSARSDFDVIVPALAVRLQEANYLVSSSAAISLGRLHTRPDIAIPALTNAYSNTNPLVRSSILMSLGEFEHQARPAIPTITSALKDDSQSVRESAAWAFKQIDPEGAEKAGVQ
jgi:HEAT repeats/PBS lyase HEAT-like repeat